MQYQAVIFDFDYTLGDSTKGIAKSVNYALNRLGQPSADISEIRPTIGFSLKDTYFMLTDDKEEQNALKFVDYFRKKADFVMVGNTELLPFAIEQLKALKQRQIKTGIVTTKFHYRIDQILEKFHANEYIDIIVGGEDVKVEKPDPEGLLYAINQMKVDRDQVLYVGDSMVDANTAENAGVHFVGVTTGTTTKEEFLKKKHDRIIRDLSEL